jgi:hypothetical protein
MAHRVRNYCSEVFRFAIAMETVPQRSEPRHWPGYEAAAAGAAPGESRGAGPARHSLRGLSRDEGERDEPSRALRWTIHTMVRTQETRFAEWSEFEGLDGDGSALADSRRSG